MKEKYLAVLMILLAVLVLPGEARGIANGLPDIVLTKLEVYNSPQKSDSVLR